MTRTSVIIVGSAIAGMFIACGLTFAQTPRGVFGGGRPGGGSTSGVGSGFRIGPAPRPPSGGVFHGVTGSGPRPTGGIQSTGGSISWPGRPPGSGGVISTPEVSSVLVKPPGNKPPNIQPPPFNPIKIVEAIIGGGQPSVGGGYPPPGGGHPPPVVYVQPQLQPSQVIVQQPPQSVTQVAPPPNALPPKKIEQPLDNALGYSLDGATAEILQEVADQNQQASQDSLNTVTATLDANGWIKGPVKDALESIQSKIDNDQPVTQADADGLLAAIESANGVKLNPAGIAAFNGLMGSIQQNSTANWLLNLAIASNLDGSGIGLPPGQIGVIPVMVWPQDEIVFVPGGDAVLTGTGGVQLNGAIASESDVLGAAVGVGEPVSNSQINFGDRNRIAAYITNPETNGAEVAYLLNGGTYSIKPGYTQFLPLGSEWDIQFDRGQGQGEARYRLQRGTYAFELSDRGWELRLVESVHLTIDNTAGANAFHYTVDDVRAEIAPGETRTETSVNPIMIRFSRGEPGKVDAKLFSRPTQAVKVAINRQDGLLDLYPADGKQLAGGSPKKTPDLKNAKSSRLLEMLKQQKPANTSKPKSPLELLKEKNSVDSAELKRSAELKNAIFSIEPKPMNPSAETAPPGGQQSEP